MSDPTLPQIFQALADALLQSEWPTLSVRVGAKFLDNNEDAMPRMVFVLPRPGEETFEAPDFIGQRAGHRPRAFRTRVAPVEIHVAAETLEDTERLAHDLASEIHKETFGSYALISGGYLSENESGWAQYGEVYVLRVAFRQPILELPMGQSEATVTVTAVAQKSEIEDPATGAVETDVDYPP